MIDPSVIDDYSKWLHAVANRLTDAANHDNIVQEGRVAMWRALATYDESKGALPTWLTRAAEMRMKDVAWGKGQPFGHEAVRGARPVEEGPSLDGLEEQVVEGLLGYVEEAYHDGEIWAAVNSLTEKQREYVFLRFWGGLDPKSASPATRALVSQFPVLKERWHWQRAKGALRERLGHLAAA